jgi:hypothetical protein
MSCLDEVRRPILLLLAAALWQSAAQAAPPAPQTICTITVNSADEASAFRRRLPAEKYRFVELVEKGRGDWLRSACEKGVQCDALLVSGHFNAGDVFYSDRLGTDEYLAVDELERASCSDSCPGLFARLKEVYLFGCESLNGDASRYASAHGDSGLGRMRRIFAGVPVIYGFPAAAPVGKSAGAILERYFDGGRPDLGTGHASARLLAAFSGSGMAATRGMDADAPGRRQICQFFDERISASRRIAFIHGLMRAEAGEPRASVERVTSLLASITEAERQSPSFVAALAEVSADDATRGRYLAAVRATRDTAARSKMIALASGLGWLTPERRAAELAAMVGDVLARPDIGLPEIELVCSLAAANAASLVPDRQPDAALRGGMARAAAMACLGDGAARMRVLAALSSSHERDVQAAQVYLRHRPVSDAIELLALARAIAAMTGAAAQVRALDTFGRLRVADAQVSQVLQGAFAAATSLGVQRAIAEVFLRSGGSVIDDPALARVLRRHRIKSPGGEDLIDLLIHRLRARG